LFKEFKELYFNPRHLRSEDIMDLRIGDTVLWVGRWSDERVEAKVISISEKMDKYAAQYVKIEYPVFPFFLGKKSRWVEVNTVIKIGSVRKIEEKI
jgi:hypothetical protein